MFDIILADCPWEDNPIAPGNRFGKGSRGHYDQLSTADLCKIPVADLAAPTGCILFQWTTWKHLEDAREVINGWGFKYITIGFVWVKINQDGSLRHNHANYTRANTEPCLLARRGKPVHPIKHHGVISTVLAQLQEHSRKPDAVQEGIEKMYPTQRRLELFGRRLRPGWTVLGNEIDGMDIFDAVNMLTALEEEDDEPTENIHPAIEITTPTICGVRPWKGNWRFRIPGSCP